MRACVCSLARHVELVSPIVTRASVTGALSVKDQANRKEKHCTKSITEMESGVLPNSGRRGAARPGRVGGSALGRYTRAHGSRGVALIGRHSGARQIEEYAVT